MCSSAVTRFADEAGWIGLPDELYYGHNVIRHAGGTECVEYPWMYLKRNPAVLILRLRHQATGLQARQTIRSVRPSGGFGTGAPVASYHAETNGITRPEAGRARKDDQRFLLTCSQSA